MYVMLLYLVNLNAELLRQGQQIVPVDFRQK